MPKHNITNEEKKQLFQRRLNGEAVSVIATDIGVPKSTVYAWLAEARKLRHESAKNQDGSITVEAMDYYQLKAHAKKLEGMLEVIKLVSDISEIPLDKKLQVLEELYHTEKYSVHLMCETLDVPRGTFYNYIKRGKKGNTVAARRREEMRERILRIYYDSNQIFGAPKIAAILKESGIPVTKGFVSELMQEMGLCSIRSGAKKQYTDESRKCKNLVKRQFKTDRPNQIWVSDVTYFRFKEKQYFICAIIDLYARRVIAHKVGFSNSTHLTKETFKSAYESRRPEAGLVFHSDQGSNYRARVFADYLKVRGVTQSFSKPGVPYDNSVMESFFSSMKREELYRYRYRSEREFRAAIDKYIEFYNTERPHESIRYKTPQKKEEEYLRAATPFENS